MVRALPALYLGLITCYGRRVAPHTGAWIETDWKTHLFYSLYVAPHTGAWIETQSLQLFRHRFPVAPHTGAWIETS